MNHEQYITELLNSSFSERRANNIKINMDNNKEKVKEEKHKEFLKEIKNITKGFKRTGESAYRRKEKHRKQTKDNTAVLGCDLAETLPTLQEEKARKKKKKEERKKRWEIKNRKKDETNN